MPVIWGRNNSVNVQKVLWCCEEMTVKYRRIDAGASEHPHHIAGRETSREIDRRHGVSKVCEIAQF